MTFNKHFGWIAATVLTLLFLTIVFAQSTPVDSTSVKLKNMNVKAELVLSDKYYNALGCRTLVDKVYDECASTTLKTKRPEVCGSQAYDIYIECLGWERP